MSVSIAICNGLIQGKALGLWNLSIGKNNISACLGPNPTGAGEFQLGEISVHNLWRDRQPKHLSRRNMALSLSRK